MLRHQHDIDPFKVSSPRIFLVRMLVFLVLGALFVVIIYKQILAAFFWRQVEQLPHADGG